jgi:C-terminal processing protease CtpA/Prc
MIIKHDVIGDIHGLFIHGLEAGSRVEEQGLIQCGDEIVALDGINVKGQYLADIVAVLEQHQEDSIKIKVYRRPLTDSIVTSQDNDNLQQLEKSNDVSDNDVDVVMETTTTTINTTTTTTTINNTTIRIISPRYEGPMMKYSRKKQADGNDMPRIGLPYLKANEYDIVVSKTGGQLKIHIRCDGDDDNKGLFVHGFMPNSNAAKEGQVLIGDELIALDGYWCRGQSLQYIATILKRHKSSRIDMRVKRNHSGKQL